MCRKLPGIAIGRLCEKCACHALQPHLCVTVLCRLQQRARFALRYATLTAACMYRRRQVRHLRLLREACDAGACLRRVQLRQLRWPLRHLRRHRHLGRVLLQGVHHARERRTPPASAACRPRARASPNAACVHPSLAPTQRDGCPKIVNLGSAKTDLFYERKKGAPRTRSAVELSRAARCIALRCRQRLTRSPATPRRRVQEEMSSVERVRFARALCKTSLEQTLWLRLRGVAVWSGRRAACRCTAAA